jgi:hypothetical protein
MFDLWANSIECLVNVDHEYISVGSSPANYQALAHSIGRRGFGFAFLGAHRGPKSLRKGVLPGYCQRLATDESHSTFSRSLVRLSSVRWTGPTSCGMRSIAAGSLKW